MTTLERLNFWALITVLWIIPVLLAQVIGSTVAAICFIVPGYLYASLKLVGWASVKRGAVHHHSQDQMIGSFAKWAIEQEQITDGAWSGAIDLPEQNLRYRISFQLRAGEDLPEEFRARRRVQ